jgi:hypothetical protein
MAERPILFSGPMVRAILSGQKTQTRRLVTPQPVSNGSMFQGEIVCRNDYLPPDAFLWERRRGLVLSNYEDDWTNEYCPYGKPGDRLWVRETFAAFDRHGMCSCKPADAAYTVTRDGGQKYRDGQSVQPLAKYSDGAFDHIKWRPSIHMPRWASRITLEAASVRVERLQDISAEDALGEGVGSTPFWKPAEVDENPKPTHEWAEPYWDDFYFWHHYPQRAFRSLWDSLNAKRAPWASNPWVWVVSFKRVEPGHA